MYNHAVDEILLFLSDRDRELMLKKLNRAAARYGIIIHAFVLMSNHIHLLIETPEPDMGPFMQHFKSCFTKAFNRIHGRKGAIFREPYHSELIKTDEQLKEILRYIHNNPVKAGIVRRPEDFTWSSMAAYLGKAKRPEWLTIRRMLDLLQGRKNFQRFTADLPAEPAASTRRSKSHPQLARKPQPPSAPSERWIA